MHETKKSVLLVAMPFAGLVIPSIQLPVLEAYCRMRGISVQTRNLYVKAAEMYGLSNYNTLIFPPNDSYTAQMVFSKYVFPEHWKNNELKLKDYFVNHVSQNKENMLFSFEEYVERTDVFISWVLEQVDWRAYDIIGFTLNYGQLLPSLAIAKKIKELSPEKIIVLGGSRTVGELGKNMLQVFEYVDYVVSGDGEEPLFRLACEQNPTSIPGLIYRNGSDVCWNAATEKGVDLNSAPLPSYDQFYQELQASTPEIQQFFHYFGRLPIEISRGCWWNKCSFCNLNIQHPCYHEKSIDRIIEEIQWLSDRYKMTDFQLIGNTLPKTNYRLLFEKIIQLKKDFSFFVEARAGQLCSDDYRLMKQAGFTMIQTGIESLSSHYLKKMNKGVRVIDNIAALKFCKENDIKNSYNLIVGYPNEEPVDFKETEDIVSLVKGFLDAPMLCELKVMHNSPIHRHPEQFNIQMLTYTTVDELMYPKEVLKKGIAFVHEFSQKAQMPKNDWESVIESWRKERQSIKLEAVKKQTLIDDLVFYFVDGGTFLKVYDKRDRQNIRIFVLNKVERMVLLTCIDVISLPEIQQRCSSIPEFELVAILQSFEKNGLVFFEDDYYLCLPLRCQVRAAADEQVKCSIPVEA